MANHESHELPPAPQSKIEFDPAAFGFDPDNPAEIDETFEAVLDLAAGDLILFALERQLQVVEKDYQAGFLPADEYFKRNDQLLAAIDGRRSALWLPVRPDRYS